MAIMRGDFPAKVTKLHFYCRTFSVFGKVREWHSLQDKECTEFNLAAGLYNGQIHRINYSQSLVFELLLYAIMKCQI